MSAGVDRLVSGWSSAATPPPALTVSQWADAHRFLPETSAARGGRWHTATVPYTRGIMDATLELGVRAIALKKCHQSAGSESLHNILGYFIEHDPCPILFVHPTGKVAEAWSKDRLGDMIRSTPALRKVITDKRDKADGDDESTLSMKLFPGGYLALGGANTPNTFARWSVRIAIGDDVDRFPAVVGEEGDPAELLTNRTTTFAEDALTIFVSTPTLKGGRIDTLYERSDQRRYFITCPGCGREDWVTWSDAKHFRVVYDNRDPETARIQCPDAEYGGCSTRIREPQRRLLLAAGFWRATVTAADPGLVGFHVPGMISTLGVTLEDLVAKFLTANSKGKEALRVFINTWLGEAWEDRGARMEPNALVGRREEYGDDVEVPAAAVAITCGVDVQEDRFEVQVQAWGMGGERWVVDWRSVPGKTKTVEAWEALREALERKYRHESGAELPIHSTCIDSGYATEYVYAFVLRYQVRRIYATKGFAGKTGEPVVGKPSEKRTGKDPRPVRLYPINVDDAKRDIMNSLSLPAPGPEYIHFPIRLDTMDEEYFAQLCSEHRETRYNKANIAVQQVWVQDRDRNEALDTAVLAYAAYKLMKPNIRQMLETLAEIQAKTKALPPAPEGGTPPPAAPAQAPQQYRRSAPSSYLRR